MGSDDISFPVFARADNCVTQRAIFLARRSNKVSCFMCHHLLKCILPLRLFHFQTMTFLFSGLFFPEILVTFFFLFGQRKLSVCHHVPILIQLLNHIKYFLGSIIFFQKTYSLGTMDILDTNFFGVLLKSCHPGISFHWTLNSTMSCILT